MSHDWLKCPNSLAPVTQFLPRYLLPLHLPPLFTTVKISWSLLQSTSELCCLLVFIVAAFLQWFVRSTRDCVTKTDWQISSRSSNTVTVCPVPSFMSQILTERKKKIKTSNFSSTRKLLKSYTFRKWIILSVLTFATYACMRIYSCSKCVYFAKVSISLHFVTILTLLFKNRTNKMKELKSTNTPRHPWTAPSASISPPTVWTGAT